MGSDYFSPLNILEYRAGWIGNLFKLSKNFDAANRVMYFYFGANLSNLRNGPIVECRD
jgi:hypothetical protein